MTNDREERSIDVGNVIRTERKCCFEIAAGTIASAATLLSAITRDLGDLGSSLPAARRLKISQASYYLEDFFDVLVPVFFNRSSAVNYCA